MEVPILKIVLVSAVTMGLSHTIAREKLFEPLRKAFGGMSTWRGYFVSCAYCASHWLAFLTGAYGIHVAPRWPVVSPILDWFLSSILVTVIAAILRVGFYFIDEEARLAKTRKRISEVEVESRQRDIH